MDTREKIMLEALDMFSNFGYSSVSIRDIAKAVNIKESSIYYHFKNKQDILDSLIDKYESYIEQQIVLLNGSLSGINVEGPLAVDNINNHFFEQYLFDPFCNQMMRFIMLEQFHNSKMAELYEKYLFELPHKYQTEFFYRLKMLGVISEEQARFLGEVYFSSTTMLTFKYLLNGELTEKKKKSFLKESEKVMKNLFGGSR